MEVDPKVLEQIQADIAKLEKGREDDRATIAGLEEALAQGADTVGQPALRKKRTFEPAFRTVRLRKYSKAGGEPDFIVGWDNKGAYEEVDKTGVRPEIVNYINVVFLSEMDRHNKAAGEKDVLKVEKVKLLDLMNKGEQVHCKITDRREEKKTDPTGEIIKVSTYDPQHGLVETGEEIDGFVTHSDIQLKVQIPGHEDIWIDQLYCNN